MHLVNSASQFLCDNAHYALPTITGHMCYAYFDGVDKGERIAITLFAIYISINFAENMSESHVSHSFTRSAVGYGSVAAIYAFCTLVLPVKLRSIQAAVILTDAYGMLNSEQRARVKSFLEQTNPFAALILTQNQKREHWKKMSPREQTEFLENDTVPPGLKIEVLELTPKNDPGLIGKLRLDVKSLHSKKLNRNLIWKYLAEDLQEEFLSSEGAASVRSYQESLERPFTLLRSKDDAVVERTWRNMNQGQRDAFFLDPNSPFKNTPTTMRNFQSIIQFLTRD